MTDITEYVLNAVVARLKSQVSDVSNRIYFEPPQNTIFPYIQYNYSVESLPIKDLDALNYIITLNVYAQRGAGSALLTVTRIAKKVYDALNRYNLILSQGTAYSCRHDGLSTPFSAEDGRTMVHVSRFKILTTN